MQKRGKERGRVWSSSGSLFVLFLVTAFGLFWLANREPSGVALTYGQFKQILDDPQARFQDVKVGRTEIRGRIITRDRISDGDKNDYHVVDSSFHTPRLGLESDPGLLELLHQRVGSSYQGEEEESALKSLSSVALSFCC